ncbi:BTB/POZ domain containing protein [Pandoravirus salinus]|uniref:BTB/POZ domain containing protein n=1 Tax=Pandoravirus salinus TaxID=1349410 RepID=S4VVD9_9VIRU|nr:BTB/POZ domain-containing protein [Pandoravirus salinus]AGO84333.1 BTB/POZ domain containing protein [Pandoravirus salinus]
MVLQRVTGTFFLVSPGIPSLHLFCSRVHHAPNQSAPELATAMFDGSLPSNASTAKSGRAADGARLPLDGRIVRLDVGGRQFKTYASTLRACPDGMLARMLDGGFSVSETDDGCLFVDRDPQCFVHILAYLRCLAGGGTASLPLPDTADALEGIASEADYFGLSGLGDGIRRRLAARERAALHEARMRAAPAPLLPDRIDLRILIARGGQKATLSARGYKTWPGRPLCSDTVVFRQCPEPCDHGYRDLGGRWDWDHHRLPDGASFATGTEDGVVQVVACQRCSAIDVAALVDDVADGMMTTDYALCSVKQFPKTTASANIANQSLLVHLAFERTCDKLARSLHPGYITN